MDGFGCASVSKALLLATGGSSLLLQSARLNGAIGDSASILIQPFIFRHLGELACGSYLLYQFRTLERQRGSDRFGAQTLVTLGASQLMNWAVTTLTDWRIYQGPYAFIACSFVSFFADIPVLQRFKVAGIPLTDKALVYAAGAQLLFSAGRNSFPSIVVGLVVGIAHQTDLFGFKKLQIPSRVSRFLGKTIGRVLGAESGNRVIVAGGAQEPSSSQAEGGRRPQAPQPAVEVSMEALEQLTAMGFEESQARAALQQCRNDVQLALNLLVQ